MATPEQKASPTCSQTPLINMPLSLRCLEGPRCSGTAPFPGSRAATHSMLCCDVPPPRRAHHPSLLTTANKRTLVLWPREACPSLQDMGHRHTCSEESRRGSQGRHDRRPQAHLAASGVEGQDPPQRLTQEPASPGHAPWGCVLENMGQQEDHLPETGQSPQTLRRQRCHNKA